MKTRELCQHLKISYSTVAGMLREGRISRPKKDLVGHSDWTAANLREIRRALANPKRKKRSLATGALP